MQRSLRLAAVSVGVVLLGSTASAAAMTFSAGSSPPSSLLDEARARGAAEASSAALAQLRPDLAAARARVDDLQRLIDANAATTAPADLSHRDTVTVLGWGTVTAAPDVLTFTMRVIGQRPGAKDALDAANTAAQRVTDAWQVHGVPRSDITVHLAALCRGSVPYDYGYLWWYGCYGGGQGGYVAVNVIDARIHHFERAGDAVAAALDAGGADAEAQGFSFDFQANQGLLQAARAAAVADARDRAAQLSTLSGRKLGPAITVTEQWSTPSSGSSGPPIAAGTAAGAAPAAAAPTPINGGQQQVGVTVSVEYQLL